MTKVWQKYYYGTRMIIALVGNQAQAEILAERRGTLKDFFD
jgi:predicted Zn-dependent peptidase